MTPSTFTSRDLLDTCGEWGPVLSAATNGLYRDNSKIMIHLLQTSNFVFFFFPDYHSEVPNLMTGMDLETEELSAFVFI